MKHRVIPKSALLRRPYCVRHRDGWCTTSKKTSAYRDNVKTLCDHYVIMPFGFERRQPDCPECLAKLAEMRRRART